MATVGLWVNLRGDELRRALGLVVGSIRRKRVENTAFLAIVGGFGVANVSRTAAEPDWISQADQLQLTSVEALRLERQVAAGQMKS